MYPLAAEFSIGFDVDELSAETKELDDVVVRQKPTTPTLQAPTSNLHYLHITRL